MSCQSQQQLQQYDNMITDDPSVPSCDRNNCRCGSSQNCMYYNDGIKSHYNYTAVQGTGSIENSEYSCVNKAFDHYNKHNMYDDHALGGLGTYGTEDGDIHGQVNYDDQNCSEFNIGQRDMCDKCDLDQPDFCGHQNEEGRIAKLFGQGEDILFDEVDVGFNVGKYNIGVEVQRWLLWIAIIALLSVLNKRGMLPKFAKDILNTKVAGMSLLRISAYLIAVYLGLSFFF